MSKAENKNFINETINRLQNELTNFIINTNYSNPQSIYLRQELCNFQEKNLKNNKNFENNKNINSENILKILNNSFDPYQNINPYTIYKIKNEYKNNKNLQNYFLSQKTYDIKNNNFNNYYNQIHFDKNNFPIIRNKEINKGINNMIDKGLIPKSSDLSPIFNKDGNPLNIIGNVKLKKLYGKNLIKDDIDLNYKTNDLKYSMKNLINVGENVIKGFDNNNNKNNNNSNILKSKTSSSEFKIHGKNISSNKTNTEFFLTNSKYSFISEKLNNENRSIISDENQKVKNISNLNTKNYKNNLSSLESNNILETIPDDNLILQFENYEIIEDSNFILFKKSNKKNWKKILNIISNLSNLFKKLNLNLVQIDCARILQIIDFYKGNIQNVRNKDLLLCITKEDLKKKGFDPSNEKLFYYKIKEAFIIKIQKLIRKKIAFKKLDNLRFELFNIILLQSQIRSFFTKKKIKNLLKNQKEKEITKFYDLFNEFKANWEFLKYQKRYEIHINSLSFNEYKNTTIANFTEKQILQLNRLINLIDPNISIIYITPYEINEDIIKYYYSILEKLGIKNIESRLIFVVPDANKFLPFYFNLSKLLFFSPKTLKQIKKIIKNDYAYIVPGITNEIEEKISVYLNIPILSGNFSQSKLILNKSGVKSSFELNDIPFPVSAWDISTEEEFYSSLAHLIATYPNFNVWIFKINNEYNGRGVAYLDISKNLYILNLKKEKYNNDNFSIEVFQEKLYLNLKNILNNNVIFAYNNLYKNFNEYLNFFLKNQGIIESCPTSSLEGIISSPSCPILIQPNGTIQFLPFFDKVNLEYFKNIVNVSPTSFSDQFELKNIVKKIGEFLFRQDIIGYITIEFITFHNGKKYLFWGIDIKFGLNDVVMSNMFSYVMHLVSSMKSEQKKIIDEMDKEVKEVEKNIEEDNNNEEEEEEKNENEENEIDDDFDLFEGIFFYDIDYFKTKEIYLFNLPLISNRLIRDLKLKEFLRAYRFENIVFNVDKKRGILFNFANSLESGVFGIFGVENKLLDKRKSEYNLWLLIEKTLSILLELMKHDKNRRNVRVYDDRNDYVDLQSVFSKIKGITKEKGKEIELEKKKLFSMNNY